MSGRKLVIAMGVVVVATVAFYVVTARQRGEREIALRTSLEQAIMRGEGRQAVELIDGAAPGALDPVWALQRKGEALVMQRAFKDSMAVAEELLARDPRSVPGLLLKGQSLAGPGYKDQALAVLGELLAIDPKNADALAERAGVFVGMKDEARALEDLNAAIEAVPGHVAARKQRCVLLITMERFLEGRQDCQAALEGLPTNHRDRFFAEYALGEAIKGIAKQDAAINAEHEPPLPEAP